MSGAPGFPGFGSQPHGGASTREHFKEVGEAVRHDREADKIAKARSKHPWWKFWRKPTG